MRNVPGSVLLTVKVVISSIMPKQLTANHVWCSMSCQRELRKWWIKVTVKDQSQGICVLKTPGQAELPPAKLTLSLTISPSLTPLFTLFCPKINIAQLENTSFCLWKKKCFSMNMSKMKEGWQSVQLHPCCIRDVILCSHSLEQRFSSCNVDTNRLGSLKRQIPLQVCLVCGPRFCLSDTGSWGTGWNHSNVGDDT